MQRKSRSIAPVVILMWTAGCQNYLPKPEPPPHAGTSLTLACPAPLEDLLRTQTSVWQARQQAQVRCLPYPADRGPEAIEADIWLLPPAQLPHWVVAGKLAAVPEALTRRGDPFTWSALLPSYREQLLLWDRAAYGVPVIGEAPVCVYRADLFASAEHQKRFRTWQQARGVAETAMRDLRPPFTWEDYALQAEYFRQHHPSGKPAASLPPLPAGEAELDRLFYTVAASYARRAVAQDEPAGAAHLDEVFSFHYDQKTGKPLIDSIGFRAALEMLKRLQACRPEGSSSAPETAFLEGKAVLCLADAGVLMRAQKVPALRDRVGVCQIPGAEKHVFLRDGQRVLKEGSNRVPYLGGAGWLAVVSARSPQREAAWSLLTDLAGPARSAQIALEPVHGGPVRADQVLRERWDAYDLDVARSLELKGVLGRTLLQHGIKNPALCLRLPEQASHRRLLVAAVRRSLQEGAEPAAELARVARLWSALDEKRGLEKHRTEYRISLGLLGD